MQKTNEIETFKMRTCAIASEGNIVSFAEHHVEVILNRHNNKSFCCLNFYNNFTLRSPF